MIPISSQPPVGRGTVRRSILLTVAAHETCGTESEHRCSGRSNLANETVLWANDELESSLLEDYSILACDIVTNRVPHAEGAQAAGPIIMHEKVSGQENFA